MIRAWLYRRTLRKTVEAADAYLGSGLAAFAAARQAERAALTHEQADALIQPELLRHRERCQAWLSPEQFTDFMAERVAEFSERYPTWKATT